MLVLYFCIFSSLLLHFMISLKLGRSIHVRINLVITYCYTDYFHTMNENNFRFPNRTLEYGLWVSSQTYILLNLQLVSRGKRLEQLLSDTPKLQPDHQNTF